MSSWNFFNPVGINFGRGIRSKLYNQISGRRCLLVTSARGMQQLKTDVILKRIFESSNKFKWVADVCTNPKIEDIEDQIKRVFEWRPEVILAFGGGSAIDSAKIIAIGLALKTKNVRDLVTLSPIFSRDAIPVFAVPTTAGTGSEVTAFATVWDHKNCQKYSIYGPSLYPHSAFVDSELIDDLPLDQTLYTGLDAINQAAESLWNKNMSPITEIMAGKAIKLVLGALPKLMSGDINALDRNNMSEASLMAGLSISQTKTSLCHSISYPLTAFLGMPHGLACAVTMPAVLRHNLKGDDGRFIRLSRLLTDKEDAGHEELKNVFDGLHKNLDVLGKAKKYVNEIKQVINLSDKMLTPSRSDNCLVETSRKDVEDILMRAFWPHEL